MIAYDYERDPAAIYRQSFATIRNEAGLDTLPKDIQGLATRLIHACGMPDILDDLRWSEGAVSLGQQALRGGTAVYCDAQMVASGIIRNRLPAENDIHCTLHDPRTRTRAKELGTTRSAAALEFWGELAGAVVAIGNAPTALFHLLENIDAGGPKPALILGFPVGFVGAAESKDALASDHHGIPFITLTGRRGGSAMAAAAVNALAAGNPEDQPGDKP